MDKPQFRKNALILRDGITDREEKSQTICENLLSTDAFKSAKTVMCYVSFRTEVETKRILETALKQGKSVCVPVVDGGTMYASYIKRTDELVPGSFGILEPCEKRPADPQDIDICIIPGAAFDLSFNRTGYGGGYYDRFLPGTKAVRIGLCFDGQICESVPTDKHDVKMDMLITEKGVLYA